MAEADLITVKLGSIVSLHLQSLISLGQPLKQLASSKCINQRVSDKVREMPKNVN